MNGESRVQQAHAFLARLVQQQEGLSGALLVSPDGLLIAHHLPPSDQLEKIAAMSTALHALGKEIGAALVLGEYRVLRVHFQTGEIYLLSAGECTLVVVASLEMAPALLEMLAQQAAQQFASRAPSLTS
jgi:predicted regulator of Ras-like GTPase activity (Roadblock/LC7/MglB family)